MAANSFSVNFLSFTITLPYSSYVRLSDGSVSESGASGLAIGSASGSSGSSALACGNSLIKKSATSRQASSLLKGLGFEVLANYLVLL